MEVLIWIRCHSVKTDTESFFRRLRLKAHFHNQTSIPQKDVFEAVNPKKSTWSPPEDQFGSLELFIRQCRHDIDTLPKFRPKRPINLTESELSALKSLVLAMTLLSNLLIRVVHW